jgi:4'-phosphopantetheinyl transferase
MDLQAGVAHVWTLPLAEAPDLTQLLSLEERERAERYVFDEPRKQFTATRGGLRLVLSRYLDVAPERIELTVRANGKPAVAGASFNVSHSHEVAVIAVARGVEVGVDVEQVRPRDSWREMAGRYFTPREAACCVDLLSFYHTWARKEAFLKALGLGLPHGLERFEVSVPPDDPPRLLHIDGDTQAARRWTLQALAPEEGYVGALAAEGPLAVTCHRWAW